MASGRGEIRVHEAIHQLGRVARRLRGVDPRSIAVAGVLILSAALSLLAGCTDEPRRLVMDDFESREPRRLANRLGRRRWLVRLHRRPEGA